MTRSSLLVKLVAAIGGVAATAPAFPALAAPPTPAETPVTVAIAETSPSRRLAVEWNPLPLVTIGKASANVIVVPVDHHALLLSPFYAWATTQPIYVFDDQGSSTQLPRQKFEGFGCEIGYRYYADRGGPRGFFVGPSLVLASMKATAQNGNQLSYADYGLALDAGYEILLADSVAVSVGAGVQYTRPSKSIPAQQFPADIYANAKVLPRMLASIGWAF
jgi:hypothetical protein